MVDNRYSGVGYEPPFETPSDKDFIEMHIKTLKAEHNRLKAENKRLHEKLAKSRAKRNEYFVALSKIANNPVYGVEVIELVTIAKAALRRRRINESR